jgi:phosphotransferase system enzyme I (PtsP)
LRRRPLELRQAEALPLKFSAKDFYRKLCAIMAESLPGRERLHKVAVFTAEKLDADLCTIHLKRDTETLEIIESVNLGVNSDHKDLYEMGEGLIGNIALSGVPCVISDCRKHPQFILKDKKNILKALMGVPILHDGAVIGVLAVRNKLMRAFTDDEVDALQMVAAFAAEIVCACRMDKRSGVGEERAHQVITPVHFKGDVHSRGIAYGKVFIHEMPALGLQFVAKSSADELDKFEEALSFVKKKVDSLVKMGGQLAGKESEEILSTYRMLADDPGLLKKIRSAIEGGLTADSAVQKVQDDIRLRMLSLEDQYIRERLVDFEDFTNRLLLTLSGYDREANDRLEEDTVLIAKRLGPAELLEYDLDRIKAIVLEEGTEASHTAILARSLSIPLIGNVKGIVSSVVYLDDVIVDGDNGLVTVRPPESLRDRFNLSILSRAEASEEEKVDAQNLQTITEDGTPVDVLMNVGFLADLCHLKDPSFKGVGLYRTEIPFMVRSGYPDVKEQIDLYTKIYAQAEDKPVVFRTLDIGGDKPLSYMSEVFDENPAMGWRAIRIGLDRPAMLRQQIRALLYAASGREVHIMFPMISDISEFDRAKSIVDMESERLVKKGKIVPKKINVGVMIEVPSLLWQMHELAKRVDFISVGSNDLFQFIFALDRANARLSRRYDVLSPPFLCVLQRVQRICTEYNIPLTICGDLARRPLEAMALLGLGVRRLSLTPSKILPLKRMISSVEINSLSSYVESLTQESVHSVREKLRFFAMDHGIIIK